MSHVYVPRLSAASRAVAEQAQRFQRIAAEVHDTGAHRQAAFGNDSQGRQFFEKWSSNINDFETGLSQTATAIQELATALDNLAARYQAAADRAVDTAEAGHGRTAGGGTPGGHNLPGGASPTGAPRTPPTTGDTGGRR